MSNPREPCRTAIDRANHRPFSRCDGTVRAVTNCETGAQVAQVAIGKGPDAAAYVEKRGLMFSSNGEALFPSSVTSPPITTACFIR
jgi:hypothetical protein